MEMVMPGRDSAARSIGRFSYPAFALAATVALAASLVGPAAGAEQRRSLFAADKVAGLHLVADDDCGVPGMDPHVLRGFPYALPEHHARRLQERYKIDPSASSWRSDPLRVELVFAHPNPEAAYKADVLYFKEGGYGDSVLRLEANGVEVHGELKVEPRKSERFLFDIPAEAYARGDRIRLRFVRTVGEDVKVCRVRLWSDDPAPLKGILDPDALAGPAASVSNAGKAPEYSRTVAPFWAAEGVVEEDWAAQDRLRGYPVFGAWTQPSWYVSDVLSPYLDGCFVRARRLLRHLQRENVGVSGALGRELAALGARRDKLEEGRVLDPEAWRKLYVDLRWVTRRIAFAHPSLRNGVLFVRGIHTTFAHQSGCRLARATPARGDICHLAVVDPELTGRIESVTEGVFPEGSFSRFDLSFDAERMVLAFGEALKPEEREKWDGPESHRQYWDGQAWSGDYQIYEMPLTHQARVPRQLTFPEQGRYSDWDFGKTIENAFPFYLPNGRIAFLSHRAGGLVQCGDWALAYCLFTMNPDGSDVRQITYAKEGEFDPILMDDGTILFTRWEYVMRFWAPTQLIWSVRPDGTNPHLIGGYLIGERIYANCRQVPGTHKIVCVEASHHNDGSGNILLVDLPYGRDAVDNHKTLIYGACFSPYPLNEDLFLVSCDPKALGRAGYVQRTQKMDLYLVDAFGGRELVHHDPKFSSKYAVPFLKRTMPPVVASVKDPGQRFGKMMAIDVHEGLPEGMRGRARHLRIVEVHERKIHTVPNSVQVGGGFATKRVLGTVPVERDGSAYFRLPAGKAVFFSVLDEDYRALHTMRMTTDVKPGETIGCIGCHESHVAAPPTGDVPLAVRRPASELRPPPWGTRNMGFHTVVQPVLNKHCIRCHDGSGGEGKSFDLTATPGKQSIGAVPVEVSYGNLKRYAKIAWGWPPPYYTPPGTWGSRVSRLTDILAKGHKGVQLSEAEWRALCAWIDCNAPYLDDFRYVALLEEDRIPVEKPYANPENVTWQLQQPPGHAPGPLPTAGGPEK
jgi:hypothetical protein